MSRAITLAGLALGSLCLVAPAAEASSTITCESNGGNYQACPIDTRGGVSLSRQLSRQGCWEGDTWGYDRNRIWVSRGCRAEFRVGDSHSSSGNGNAVAGAVALAIIGAAIVANKNKDKHDDYDDNRYNDRYNDNSYGNGYYGGHGNPRWTVTCSSTGGRFTYCNLPGRGEVEVYKQLSSGACNYGQSWGVEGNRLWVSNGCRAEFAVY